MDALRSSSLYALSVIEPLAWAMTDAGRFIENLDCTPLQAGVILRRGDYVAIHAAGPFDEQVAAKLAMMLAGSHRIPSAQDFAAPGQPGELRLESAIAVARFYDVFEDVPNTSSQHRWRTSTRYAWFFDKIWKLPGRVPCRGEPKIWTIPEEVLEDVCQGWGKVCNAPD